MSRDMPPPPPPSTPGGDQGGQDDRNDRNGNNANGHANGARIPQNQANRPARPNRVPPPRRSIHGFIFGEGGLVPPARRPDTYQNPESASRHTDLSLRTTSLREIALSSNPPPTPQELRSRSPSVSSTQAEIPPYSAATRATDHNSELHNGVDTSGPVGQEFRNSVQGYNALVASGNWPPQSRSARAAVQARTSDSSHREPSYERRRPPPADGDDDGSDH